YALIEWADTVVTFGSTVTIEACWMGRPAIMLGPSFYDALDIAYTPGSMEETHQLLRSKLSPKDRTNCARWATFVETDWDDLPRLHHNGRTFVSDGFDAALPAAARLAKLSDNLFYRIVKWGTGLAAGWRRGRESGAIRPVENSRQSMSAETEAAGASGDRHAA
ncbi:MAG: hypothetical protein ACPGXX_10890, partial [Planctomycetaceae bacterium]